MHGSMMGAQVGKNGSTAMARLYTVAVVAFTCLHMAGFGWWCGPVEEDE
jgi:aspartate oxidase